MFNDKKPVQNGPNGCLTEQLVMFTESLCTKPYKVTFKQKIHNKPVMVPLVYLF